MKTLAYLASGLIFGVGLVLAGMSNPAKVLNFLDIAGTWDPSLAFVMAGGIAVTFVGYRLVFGRPAPLFAGKFAVPTSKALDGKLIGGAALFGVGWGLAGFCPGPAFTALSFGGTKALIFMAAMLVGMTAARMLACRSSAAPAVAPAR